MVITDYIRPMLNFKSLDELMAAINNDIEVSKQTLTEEVLAHYAKHEFFTEDKQ